MSHVAVEVASALAYAHERFIVRRDIKPDSGLFSGGGAAIIDFGIAKALSTSSNGRRDLGPTRTA